MVLGSSSTGLTLLGMSIRLFPETKPSERFHGDSPSYEPGPRDPALKDAVA